MMTLSAIKDIIDASCDVRINSFDRERIASNIADQLASEAGSRDATLRRVRDLAYDRSKHLVRWIDDSALVDVSDLLEALGDTEPPRVVVQMPLKAVLLGYQDGDQQGWFREFLFLKENHSERLDFLATSIQETGMKEPILLGSDRRVWDGHHRLYVADMLGLETVPVTFSETN